MSASPRSAGAAAAGRTTLTGLARALRPRAGEAVQATIARPTHVVLFCLVAGLLSGPRAPVLALSVAMGMLVGAVGLAWVARGTGQPAPGHATALRGAEDLRTDLESRTAEELRRRARLLLLVGGVAILVGAGIGAARVSMLERTALGSEIGARLDDEPVTVTQAARRAPFGGWSALAELHGEPALLRVRDPATPLPEVGAVLAVTGSLRAPGEYASLRHAHAELTAEQLTPDGVRGGLAGLVDGVRRRAERALDRGLPPNAAALFRGMVLGQDDALDDPTREAFRAAGLSHLVAASGTNVVLLAALAMGLGTALGLGLSARLWLVLALIVLYVPLAGGGASIQRAGVMGAAAVAAGLVGRPSSRWYALGLAAVLTLVLDPRAAGEPGWQLSFVAVLSLLLLAPGWRTRLIRRGVPAALAEVTAMTGAATLATAPVIAVHFGQASLVGLPANVLAAPAVAPVMWLGVVAGALGQLAGPGGALLGALLDGLDALAGFPLGYLALVGRTAARIPGSNLEVGPLPVTAVTCAVLAAVGSVRVRRALPPLACVGAAAWIAFVPPRPAVASRPEGFRLTFLDVGQGDATLLQEGDRSVLVDTGPPDGGILARLREAGVDRLEVLVLTHAQQDHDGAAAAVVEALPVRVILDGRDGVRTATDAPLEAAARRTRTRLVPGRTGQRLRVGALGLRVLWPPGRVGGALPGEDPNDRAIVLEAEAPGARALLTADAESDVLSRLDLRAVDLLKVAHHGSADPGLPALLTRLQPQIAGIEVGEDNTYGHPAPPTLTALAGVPAVVRTDRDGSVRVERGPNGWELRRAR